MIEAWTATDVRAAEAPLLQAGVPLMDRAAFALATAVLADLRMLRGRASGARVVLLVGAGNNGGDALFAGARLARRGVAVTALSLAGNLHPGGVEALRAAGGRFVRIGRSVADAGDLGVSGSGGGVESRTDDGSGNTGVGSEECTVESACSIALRGDVVVDGIVGIGGRGALRGVAGEVVSRLARALHRKSRPVAGQLRVGQPLIGQSPVGQSPAGQPRIKQSQPSAGLPSAGREGDVPLPWVLAVDVPSGIGVDDGTVPGPVLPADRTVTFGGARAGLLVPPASYLVGEITVADIGLTFDRAPAVRRLERVDVGAAWPVPGPEDHKYTRGVVGMVAGTPTYPGAAVLSTSAAIYAGAGMVRYLGAVPAQVLTVRPEVVTAPGRVQAWVVGPGLPVDDESGQHDVVRSVLRSALGKVPVVVDAGALPLLPAWVPSSIVLTPHAGELAALLQSRDVDVDRVAVEAEPLRWARRAQQLTGATVLLKGAATVIVGSDGDHDGAQEVFVQAEGPAWLATAGSGDVLAGVLGTMLAAATSLVHEDRCGQAISPYTSADARIGHVSPARIAAAAVHIHGRAGALAGPGPVAALDVAHAVARAVAESLSAAGR